MPAAAYSSCPALLHSISCAVVGFGIAAKIGRNAVSITRPSGSSEPSLRTITPPGGVTVSAVMSNRRIAAELSTAPCIETCPTSTGISGKSASRSSLCRVRPPGIRVSS